MTDHFGRRVALAWRFLENAQTQELQEQRLPIRNRTLRLVLENCCDTERSPNSIVVEASEAT